MSTLADRLLPDRLWQRIRPLLPPPPSHARGGARRMVPDRAKSGSKLHVAAEASGPPVALLVTAANTNDSVVFEALLHDLPAVRDPDRWAALPPGQLPRDKAYDRHAHELGVLAGLIPEPVDGDRAGDDQTAGEGRLVHQDQRVQGSPSPARMSRMKP
jgi:hypothetical protein